MASGFDNPRGFTWGPDGTLYLAQAGRGGDNHIPVAPGYTIDNGLTSSVVTVANGCVTPVVQGLVSTLWEEPGWLWGAMDVAMLDMISTSWSVAPDPPGPRPARAVGSSALTMVAPWR